MIYHHSLHIFTSPSKKNKKEENKLFLTKTARSLFLLIELWQREKDSLKLCLAIGYSWGSEKRMLKIFQRFFPFFFLNVKTYIKGFYIYNTFMTLTWRGPIFCENMPYSPQSVLAGEVSDGSLTPRYMCLGRSRGPFCVIFFRTWKKSSRGNAQDRKKRFGNGSLQPNGNKPV